MGVRSRVWHELFPDSWTRFSVATVRLLGTALLVYLLVYFDLNDGLRGLLPLLVIAGIIIVHAARNAGLIPLIGLVAGLVGGHFVVDSLTYMPPNPSTRFVTGARFGIGAGLLLYLLGVGSRIAQTTRPGRRLTARIQSIGHPAAAFLRTHHTTIFLSVLGAFLVVSGVQLADPAAHPQSPSIPSSNTSQAYLGNASEGFITTEYVITVDQTAISSTAGNVSLATRNHALFTNESRWTRTFRYHVDHTDSEAGLTVSDPQATWRVYWNSDATWVVSNASPRSPQLVPQASRTRGPSPVQFFDAVDVRTANTTVLKRTAEVVRIRVGTPLIWEHVEELTTSVPEAQFARHGYTVIDINRTTGRVTAIYEYRASETGSEPVVVRAMVSYPETGVDVQHPVAGWSWREFCFDLLT